MDDAAVPPALMAGELGLLLEKRDLELGVALEQGARAGAADDSAAGDDDVEIQDLLQSEFGPLFESKNV